MYIHTYISDTQYIHKYLHTPQHAHTHTHTHTHTNTHTHAHTHTYTYTHTQTEHQKKVRDLEKEALENRDNPQKEEAKISLILDQDVPTSFVCKDTLHY